jgi:predicted peroxiredoxin
MALKPNGGLATITLVLTEEQLSALRRIRAERLNGHNRVSVSDVAREVVAEGLRVISCDGHSDFSASRNDDKVAA